MSKENSHVEYGASSPLLEFKVADTTKTEMTPEQATAYMAILRAALHEANPHRIPTPQTREIMITPNFQPAQLERFDHTGTRN